MTATSIMDDQTTSAIREAMSLAAAGRMSEACRVGEHALEAGGDTVALNAMLGAIHCQSGNLPAGIGHLRTAHNGRPTDPVITSNLAMALGEQGDFQGALEVATDEIARKDRSLRLARMRGFFAQQVRDFPSAIATYEFVVETDPTDWETWNNLGNAKLGSGDFPGGIAALRRACELSPGTAPTRLNLCNALRDAGEFAEAELQLRKMVDDFPSDVKALIALHDLLLSDGRGEGEAVKLLEQAVERDPRNTELLLALARGYFESFSMDQAEETYRSVLRMEPANEGAFLGLMMIGEHVRPSLLEQLPEEAVGAGVGSAAFNLISAFSHRRAARYVEGLAALEHVPQDFEAVRRAQVKGQLLDATGDYDPAFAAFEEMNRALAEDQTQPLERAFALREHLAKQLRLTTAEWIKTWSAPPVEPSGAAPVILVGFPRSGTTLLDTMLMGHPEVEVLEERPLFSRLEQEIGSLEAIAALDHEQIRDLRIRYWALAAGYVDLSGGKLLVDKSPLSLNRAVFIHRIFPNARFILALRHPADVVLSCFMASFRLNSSMANFLKLETAAEFYDLSFQTWANARSILPLDVQTVKYEQVVQDVEAELRPVVEGLGLIWDANILEHQRTAGARGVISTASYAQVTQPLYRGAVDRWKRYRKHLEPVLPTLEPWAKKFGYEI